MIAETSPPTKPSSGEYDALEAQIQALSRAMLLKSLLQAIGSLVVIMLLVYVSFQLREPPASVGAKVGIVNEKVETVTRELRSFRDSVGRDRWTYSMMQQWTTDAIQLNKDNDIVWPPLPEKLPHDQ